MISVEEYLSTSYRPDCDYVDGEVIERNVGERDHSWAIVRVATHLFNEYNGQGFFPFISLRVRVKPNRVRVPDVCVTVGFPDEQVLTKPPALCVEILSPEDCMTSIQKRIDDYLQMGVPMVWILDPESKRTYTASSADGLCENKTGVLRTENSVLELPLSEIFPP